MKRCRYGLMILLIITIITLIMVGCRTMTMINNDDKVYYMGDNPELYSVAINSLLGAKGYIASEVRFSPLIKLIEEDQYGRRLFLYFEDSSISTYSLLISQTFNEEYVYFYPDYNFISISKDKVEGLNFEQITEENFLIEEIEKLKQVNDWNQELDISQCIVAEIVCKKQQGTVKNRTLEKLYDKALEEDAHGRYKSYTRFFMSDDYGRSIYLGYGKHSSKRFVVLLFESDECYDESKGIMELEDLQNYQDDLKAFKELNNWNQPFPSE